MKGVYLDYASITPTDKRVLKEMVAVYKSGLANPSALHTPGVLAKKILDNSRTKCAESIKAHSDEIFFTSSGTSSNNLAIHGLFRYLIKNGTPPSDIHIMVSAIEHSSVLETVKEINSLGAKVDYIPVNEFGIVDLDFINKNINKHTVMISVMMANNEIGTVEPIQEIAKIIRHWRKTNQSIFPYFHTDASQAYEYLDIDVEKMGVDFLTLDSHKVYGPKGIGLLYKKRNVPCLPVIFGGGQEKGIRSGTENVPSIAGFALALEISKNEREKEEKRVSALRTYFIEQLRKYMPNIIINGDPDRRLANNVNITLPGIDAEMLMLRLDAHGIFCSTKSSCLRDSKESYVLSEVGASSRSSLRFSLGRFTNKNDIKYTVKMILKLSPLSKIDNSQKEI